MEDILLGGFQYRVLNWRQLATVAGIPEVSDRTIRRYMQDLDYHSCIACDKSWISPRMKEQRIKFSRKMLQLRPNTAVSTGQKSKCNFSIFGFCNLAYYTKSRFRSPI